MPTLLNSAVPLKGTTGTNSYFITLDGAQPYLGSTPTTGTGFTLVTGPNGQLGFTSTIGFVGFNNGVIQTTVPNGDLTLQSTGTGKLNLNGNVYLNGQLINAGAADFSNLTATNLTVTGAASFTSATSTASFLSSVQITPTTGTVVIDSYQTGSIDNMIIGQTAPQNGFFTTIYSNLGTFTSIESTSGYFASISSDLVTAGVLSVNTLTSYNNLTALGNVALTPVDQDVNIAPSLNGTVYINPARTGYMDNMIIGATSADAGYFTDLHADTLTLNQSLVLTTGSFNLVLAEDLVVTSSTRLTNLLVTGTSTLTSITVLSDTNLNTLSVTGTTNLTVLEVSSDTTLNNLSVTGTSTLSNLTVEGLATLSQANVTTLAADLLTATNIISTSATITESLYAGSLYDSGNRVLTEVTVTAGTGLSGGGTITGTSGTVTLVNEGVTSLTAGTDTVLTTSTGDLLIWNNSTLQSITDRGSNTTNAVQISNTASSTSSLTGALVVSGGVGITGKLSLAPSSATAPLNIGPGSTPTTLINGDVWTTSTAFNIRLSGVTYSVGFLNANNVWSSSNNFTGGTQTFGSNVGNSLIRIATGATVSGSTKTVEIGTNGTAGSTTTIHVGSNDAETIVTFNNSATISVLNNAASNSTQTGAFVIAGGVGVGDNVHVEGDVYSDGGSPYYNRLLYTPKVTVNTTPPVNPRIGDFWIDPNVGVEYQLVPNGTSTVWVQFIGF